MFYTVSYTNQDGERISRPGQNHIQANLLLAKYTPCPEKYKDIKMEPETVQETPETPPETPPETVL